MFIVSTTTKKKKSKKKTQGSKMNSERDKGTKQDILKDPKAAKSDP